MKETEYFNKMRVELIDLLIQGLNHLKDDSLMTSFRGDREFFKQKIDDIFDSFDRGNDYIAMKEFFELNIDKIK